MSDGPGYVTIKLRLPSALVERLERVARRRGVRRGRLIASLLADWVEDYVGDRFEHFSTRDNRINVVDKFLGEIIPVSVMKGELYCEYCKSFTCGHTRYAKKIYARWGLMSRLSSWENFQEP
ncbi:MAG: hypothetical protein NZ918_04540 [Aigarchaeota archaeon]|nr:hypothetical protein [Aigarchaeota archaeon]MDW8021926.1 hypothetical protein [Nitrososphaerota archaeon]